MCLDYINLSGRVHQWSHAVPQCMCNTAVAVKSLAYFKNVYKIYFVETNGSRYQVVPMQYASMHSSAWL